ncbi:H-NS family nucleoid-associated regulatory protein [Ideonella sp. YS5]|uniref:H-NS family nucleoid-associated regulatory protein n=1 Tax=Ideonella sp. YS5 TaxID=3453714 RepID=UPI003EECB804
MVDRLASIKKQIAALEKKAQGLLKAQNQKVIDRVRALIDKHGLTAEDLGFAASSVPRGGGGRLVKQDGASQAGTPRYRDPSSGKTWTGRGKPPRWIASAKDRSAFLINSDAAEEIPPKKGRGIAATKSTGKVRRKSAAPAAAKQNKSKPAGAKSSSGSRNSTHGKAAAEKSVPASKTKAVKTPPSTNKRKSNGRTPKPSAPNETAPVPVTPATVG